MSTVLASVTETGGQDTTQDTSKIGVALSMPALLVNPSLRHLQQPAKRKPLQGTKARDVGKRKARRAENGK